MKHHGEYKVIAPIGCHLDIVIIRKIARKSRGCGKFDRRILPSDWKPPLSWEETYFQSKCNDLLDKLEFVELINADSLFLHKPHTPNYRKGS